MLHQTNASSADNPRAQRRAAQREAQLQQAAEAAAKIDAMPVAHAHAAGIDVGDRTHWVCVEKTPDGSDPIREFPAHTPGLRQLVAWVQGLQKSREKRSRKFTRLGQVGTHSGTTFSQMVSQTGTILQVL